MQVCRAGAGRGLRLLRNILKFDVGFEWGAALEQDFGGAKTRGVHVSSCTLQLEPRRDPANLQEKTVAFRDNFFSFPAACYPRL